MIRPALLQRRTKVGVVLEQGAGNAVTNSAGLSRRSAAANIDQNVKLGDCLGQLQRLPNNHAQSFVGKILYQMICD